MSFVVYVYESRVLKSERFDPYVNLETVLHFPILKFIINELTSHKKVSFTNFINEDIGILIIKFNLKEKNFQI